MSRYSLGIYSDIIVRDIKRYIQKYRDCIIRNLEKIRSRKKIVFFVFIRIR